MQSSGWIAKMCVNETVFFISYRLKYIKLLAVPFAIIYLQKCLIRFRMDKTFLFSPIFILFNHIYIAITSNSKVTSVKLLS